MCGGELSENGWLDKIKGVNAGKAFKSRRQPISTLSEN